MVGVKRTTKDDAHDWAGALKAAATRARDLNTGPTLGPEARCLCGSTDPRGRITFVPVDLADDDVTLDRNEGWHRTCQACQHPIPDGAMCVRRHYGPTTTVRDHYHTACVRL